MSAGDWTKWTVDEVCAWLESHELGEYSEAFRENEVDGDVLEELDADMLKEMGLTKLGPRTKVLKRIKAMKDADAAAAAAAAAPPAETKAEPTPTPAAATPAATDNNTAAAAPAATAAAAATTDAAASSPAKEKTKDKSKSKDKEKSKSKGKSKKSKKSKKDKGKKKRVRYNEQGKPETREERAARRAVEKAAKAAAAAKAQADADAVREPEACGWLTKEGGQVKSWRRRYFVLQDYVLSYYKSEDDYKKRDQPLGRIPIPSYEVDFSNKKKNCFQVSHAGCRTYFFAADNREEMERWMKAIREQGLATASDAWFRAEAAHYTVEPREDGSGFDVSMSMDQLHTAVEIVPLASYRYKCKWKKGDATKLDVHVEATKRAIIVTDPATGDEISSHPYTSIQRYMVDAADPVFSFLQVKDSVMTVLSFHMGNRAIALHINQVMTGHIAELTKVIKQIRSERAKAAAEATGGASPAAAGGSAGASGDAPNADAELPVEGFVDRESDSTDDEFFERDDSEEGDEAAGPAESGEAAAAAADTEVDDNSKATDGEGGDDA